MATDGVSYDVSDRSSGNTMELQLQDIANVRLICVEGRIDLTTAQSFQDLLLPQLFPANVYVIENK